MKYFPLIGAALWRNPAETLLTWLAATVAFTLFGLMVGLYVHTQRLIDLERMDRAYVVQRFPTQPYIGLPVGMVEPIRAIAGVTGVGTAHWLDGYHADPRNSTRVMAVDEGMPGGWPEAPMTPLQWKTLFATPNGAYATRMAADRWNLRSGDTFQFTSPQDSQADGNPTRAFQILGVIGDIPYGPQGLFVANYRYINNSEAHDKQNLGNMFYVALADPKRALEICRRIDRRFANSGTPTFCVPRRTDAEGLANSNINIAMITLTVAGAGLFMILFLIANVIARSVSERVPEFAVLKTLGFRQPHMMLLVVAEAAVPCLLGALVGLGVAHLLTQVSVRLLTGDLGRLLSNPEYPPSVIAGAFGFAIALAFACSVIPLQRLRTLSVVDALAGR
ncbi:MAG TPA: ABC transporter permease [Steroidobacteraceae bacterium]|jgi:putative ABC transport system permease protein